MPARSGNQRASDETRSKIRNAAEQLFAQEGFDRVTLRRIARDADQRNVAAVQYHFGSKQGLLSAIVDDHRSEIDDRRAALLEGFGGEEPDLETLIGFLVEPLAAKLDDASGRAYLQIQAQGLSNDEMRPATRSLVERIGRHMRPLDDGQPDAYRGRFAVLLLFHALADRAEAEQAGRVRRNDRPAFIASLTRAIEGLFSA